MAITFDDGPIYDVEGFTHPRFGAQRGFLGIMRDFVAARGSCAQPGLSATSFVIASAEARQVIEATYDAAYTYVGPGAMTDAWWNGAIDSGLIAIGNHSWDHLHPALPRVAHSRQARGDFTQVLSVEDADAQIADAVQRGAKVLCGGDRIHQPGNWFEPTVVVDVPDAAALMREESFGPVIGVARVSSDREAAARMNDTEFGLGASVFSRDRDRAERLLAGLDVGNAYWNTADRSCVRLPWAGRRHSGLGTSMSESGVRTFVREKAWHLFS